MFKRKIKHNEVSIITFACMYKNMYINKQIQLDIFYYSNFHISS